MAHIIFSDKCNMATRTCWCLSKKCFHITGPPSMMTVGRMTSLWLENLLITCFNMQAKWFSYRLLLSLDESQKSADQTSAGLAFPDYCIFLACSCAIQVWALIKMFRLLCRIFLTKLVTAWGSTSTFHTDLWFFWPNFIYFVIISFCLGFASAACSKCLFHAAWTFWLRGLCQKDI